MAIRRSAKSRKASRGASFVVRSAEGGRFSSKGHKRSDASSALSQVRAARARRRSI